MRDAFVLIRHHFGHFLLDVDFEPEIVAFTPGVQQFAQPVASLL